MYVVKHIVTILGAEVIFMLKQVAAVKYNEKCLMFVKKMSFRYLDINVFNKNKSFQVVKTFTMVENLVRLQRVYKTLGMCDLNDLTSKCAE